MNLRRESRSSPDSYQTSSLEDCFRTISNTISILFNCLHFMICTVIEIQDKNNIAKLDLFK